LYFFIILDFPFLQFLYYVEFGRKDTLFSAKRNRREGAKPCGGVFAIRGDKRPFLRLSVRHG